MDLEGEEERTRAEAAEGAGMEEKPGAGTTPPATLCLLLSFALPLPFAGVKGGAGAVAGSDLHPGSPLAPAPPACPLAGAEVELDCLLPELGPEPLPFCCWWWFCCMLAMLAAWACE